MWAVVYLTVCVQSGKRHWWMSHGGMTRVGVLRDESLLHIGVSRQSFGKPCNLLIHVNHLVKVIVLVNRAVWQVCRFPHYRIYVQEGVGSVVFCWNDSSLDIKYLKGNYKGILVYEILMDCVARKRIQKTTSNYLKWFSRYCDLNFYKLSH